MPLALAVHGGAWNTPDAAVHDSREGIREALTQGWHALRSGKSALDVVELAVRALEDDPTFDAGRGSRLNIEREVEMDASIMDGRDLRAGAVAAIRQVRHPVSVARQVLEVSSHAMLVGEAALVTLERIGGKGGLIALNTQGRLAAVFNTPRMARGPATEDEGMRVAVNRTEPT